MSKRKNNSSQPDKSPPSAGSPIADAASAAMPLVYSAQIARQQITTGPVPTPEMIAQYNAAIPGLGDRLVRMAEEEASHRRSVEIEVIKIQGRDQKAYRLSELLGQIFGLAIGLSAIWGAVYAATHGAQWAGSFIGTAGVTGLVSAFILGRRYLGQQKEQDYQHRMEAARRQDEKSTISEDDSETPDT